VAGAILILATAAAVDAQERSPVALDVKARGPKPLYVDTTANRNQVSVFSESTLEDFTVVCNQVNGQWQFNPQDVDQIKGKFSIRVDDLRTGIPRRDHDLREPEWLDAAKYPLITITIDRGEGAQKVSPNVAKMTLVGQCSLHGVTHEVRVPAQVAYLDESPKTMERVKGDLCRIRADFQIKLSDYKILGPPASGTIGLKVADTLPIKVSVFGSTERPPPPLKVDRAPTASQPTGILAPPGAPGMSILQPPTQPASAR
jgi:polyisoprenoid-binding protein YceI